MGKRAAHNLNRWKKLQGKKGRGLAKDFGSAKDFDFKKNSDKQKSLRRTHQKELREAKKERKIRLLKQRVKGTLILPGSVQDRLRRCGPLDFVERKLRRTGPLSWEWYRKASSAPAPIPPQSIGWPPASISDMLSTLGGDLSVTERIKARFLRLRGRFLDQEARPLGLSAVLKDCCVPKTKDAIAWATLWAFLARFVAFCPVERVLDGFARSMESVVCGEEQTTIVVGEYSPAQVVLLVGHSWPKRSVVKRIRRETLEVVWDSAAVSPEAVTLVEELPAAAEDMHWHVSDEELSDGSFFE